ncbi:MAG: hypothetical protein FWF59_13580 [Turicibacter sp.]|nr:hypothetical protein [Turicibacter sp.]
MFRKIILCLGAVFALAACSGNEVAWPDVPDSEIDKISLDDGTFFAIEDEFNEDGWKYFVEFTIADGLLTHVSFDGVNIFAATFKSAAAVNGLSPEDEGEGLRWDEQISLLEDSFLKFQSYLPADILETAPEDEKPAFDIDVAFLINLFKRAANEGPREAGPYLDGQYFMAQDVNGEYLSETPYRYFLNMIVRHGYIIAVHWNAINGEGLRKYEPILPGSLLDSEGEALLWRAQADLLETHLIATQDPMLMTFDEDQMSQELFGIHIPVQSFVELAVSALAAGPILEQQ